MAMNGNEPQGPFIPPQLKLKFQKFLTNLDKNDILTKTQHQFMEF